MKTVKCNKMVKLKKAIKEKVNLDLTSWNDGDIDLEGVTTGDINLGDATTGNIDLGNSTIGNIYLRNATTGYINLRNSTIGYLNLKGAKTGNINLRNSTTDYIDLRNSKTGNIDLEDSKTGDIKQKYTAKDLDFLRKLPLEIIDMRQWQSNDNWLTAQDIHTCGTTYCVRGYAESQYFAKNGVAVKNVESLYPNLKHLFFMSNEQFKAELNKII